MIAAFARAAEPLPEAALVLPPALEAVLSHAAKSGDTVEFRAQLSHVVSAPDIGASAWRTRRAVVLARANALTAAPDGE